MNRLLLMLTS